MARKIEWERKSCGCVRTKLPTAGKVAPNGGIDPFVLDEPMDLGLPVDDEKIAEELRIRNEVAWGYFKDDYTVLGHCLHGVDLDREFCPEGCRV